MTKIDDELINDYIDGNDISNIEELENNEEFMKSVIDKTNDKNFYNLCSNELKINYDFIIYLVNKFKNDKEFICKITDHCLVNNVSEDPFLRMELAILVGNSVDKDTSYRYMKFLDILYQCSRIEIEALKINDNNPQHTKSVGMGFILFFDFCHGNELLLNYIASKMIKDIFGEYDIDLEGLLHKRFKSVDELNDMGVNTFLINFIESFDSMLSSYVSTHLDLMSSYVSRVEKIKTKWNKYNEVTEIRKYNKILDVIYDYMKEAESAGTLTEDQVLYYVGKKFGIMDKLHYYDTLNVRSGMDSFGLHDDEDYKNEYNVDEELLEDSIKSNFANKMILLNVEKMVSEILYPSAPTDEEIALEQNGGKTIKFELNKKVN